MEFDLNQVHSFLQSYQVVVLQFHSSVLNQSVPILKQLEEMFPSKQFLLIGDSPFTSCCTDEASARHINADCIIHFGHSCRINSNMPTMQLQGSMDIDFNTFQDNIRQIQSPVRLILSRSVSHLEQEIKEAMLKQDKEISEDAPSKLCIGVEFIKESSIDGHLENLYIYNSSGITQISTYQFLSQRYSYISKVQTSKIFGIVILSIEVYRNIAQRLQTLLKNAGKTFYTIYCGKINLLKLGNFAEIDLFVQVGCPFTPLPDNKEFLAPVITPFELECGLSGEWNGEYLTNYGFMLDKPMPDLINEPIDDITVNRFQYREFRGLGHEKTTENWEQISQIQYFKKLSRVIIYFLNQSTTQWYCHLLYFPSI